MSALLSPSNFFNQDNLENMIESVLLKKPEILKGALVKNPGIVKEVLSENPDILKALIIKLMEDDHDFKIHFSALVLTSKENESDSSIKKDVQTLQEYLGLTDKYLLDEDFKTIPEQINSLKEDFKNQEYNTPLQLDHKIIVPETNAAKQAIIIKEKVEKGKIGIRIRDGIAIETKDYKGLLKDFPLEIRPKPNLKNITKAALDAFNQVVIISPGSFLRKGKKKISLVFPS
jgi:hypothetical protein